MAPAQCTVEAPIASQCDELPIVVIVTVTITVTVIVISAGVVVVTIMTMIMIIIINVMDVDGDTTVAGTADSRTDSRRIATKYGYCRRRLRHKDLIASAVGRDRV